jgi:Tfp pilus assembly protein PilF
MTRLANCGCCLIRGNAEGAEREIKRALAILPDYPAAKHDLAIVEQIKRQRVGD